MAGRSLLSLFLLASCFLFTEESRLNDHIAHHELLQLEASSSATSHHRLAATFNFVAFGRPFHLRLKTHSTLFHPDFHLLLVGEGGVRKTRPSMRHFVTGTVEGEKDSVVYGRIVNNSFDGIIRLKGESYHIDPLHHHSLEGKTGGHNRVIYRSSDVEYEKVLSTCHSGEFSKLAWIQKSSSDHYENWGSMLRRKRQSSDMNTCTVKVVADERFFENVGGGSDKNTVDEMVLHLMDADNVYRTTVFQGNNGPIQGSRLSIHSSVIYVGPNNPLSGEYNVDELLSAFSEANFDDVCLGHLFTYRDFQGTIGLAYLGDPNGQFAGGICQKRTRTSIGDANLNTGFTSLLNFGMKLSRAISFITVAHEIGHNHGSPHDLTGECYDGRYIMFPQATTGNNKAFSDCSKSSIGRTIEARGSCFTAYPTGAECGNGIIEIGEDCDCGETEDQERCFEVDPCCLVNCTLKEGADCSSKASTCCGRDTCKPLNDNTVLCLKGDTDIEGGGCQKDTYCEMDNFNCPNPSLEANGTFCNNGSNVCENGACTGSICLTFDDKPQPCYCNDEAQLCHVCCMFDGKCTSTFDQGGRPTYLAPNYPCKNFTGYCTEDHVCKSVNNDDILNNLRDILLDFSSIWEWVKDNWYWVLGGFATVVVLIILLQITYRRKPLKIDGQPVEQHCCGFGKRRRPRVRRGAAGNRNIETSGLLTDARTAT